MGTVRRAYTANKINAERSKRTRPCSHGLIACQRFHWENQRSTAAVARAARRCLLSGAQLRSKGYTITVNGHESFLTNKRRRKSNDVTRRRQRHIQSCVHAEDKRSTVCNLSDVETRLEKCERRVAQTSRLVSMRTKEQTRQENAR